MYAYLPACLLQGHGTHVAGICAGTIYGVAKKAIVHPVKTMGDGGSGSYSDIIAGGCWQEKFGRGLGGGDS